MSTLREDNRRLNQAVTDLRGDRRAQDRKLRDMQHRLDELRAKVAVDVAASVPALPVEVAAPAPVGAAPADARVVAVADDGTEIVYEGEAAGSRAVTPASLPGPTGHASPPGPASPAGPAGDDPPPRRAPPARPAAPLSEVPVVAERLEVTRRVPPIATRAARRTRDHDGPAERGGDAASDYRASVELVKAGKHDDAIAALRAFVARYPRHDYADNAQYWLGEAFYAQADYGRALTEFRRVVEVYPRGNKVPDALLKVGYCHQAIGQTEKARAVLEQVVNLYPKSEPAMLAARRLETP